MAKTDKKKLMKQIDNRTKFNPGSKMAPSDYNMTQKDFRANVAAGEKRASTFKKAFALEDKNFNAVAKKAKSAKKPK